MTTRTMFLTVATLSLGMTAAAVLVGCSSEAESGGSEVRAATPGDMAGAAASGEQEMDTATDPAYVLGYTMDRLDGISQDLSAFEGKVVLIVNTASRCGLTPQYEGLQTLYESRRENGLVVLGFPSNDFMGQEPGTDEEIAAFCEENYGVEFPMFSKVAVKGDDAVPLYAQLASQTSDDGGEPSWNFTKYLVDRKGRVVKRFDPRVSPDSPELTAMIDELLRG
jgi:glutathione peroxidase